MNSPRPEIDAAIEDLKREVRRVADGWDMDDDPYDLGWNHALAKASERIQTERTMHNAWRKRAEESEASLNTCKTTCDTLRDMLTAAKSVGWRAIESAPRDGTHIWAWSPVWDRCLKVYFLNGHFLSRRSKPPCQPTHWQPLPLPPSTTSEG